MCAAEADDEPTRVGGLQVGVQGRHRLRFEPVDGDDPAGDPNSAGGAHKISDLPEAAEWAARQPDRRIAQVLQLDRCVEETVRCGAQDRTDRSQLDLRHQPSPPNRAGHPTEGHNRARRGDVPAPLRADTSSKPMARSPRRAGPGQRS